MISQALFRKYMFCKTRDFIRHVRSVVPHGVTPKRIKGKVKTVTEFEESERDFKSYKDFIKSIEKSKLGDELEVEKQFLTDDYYGEAIEKCDMYYDMDQSEKKKLKSDIKKKIVGRKYFKLDKETNLLTHAAKEQIRFLHESNPLEWNCKTLSECFPISEAGVKKLLKSYFSQTCPEKIKLHDEDVARKWKILKSGKPTDEIYPLTQKLYKEGKLVDDYFSGNPNLPTVPPLKKKIIEVKKPETVGEFSAIVKTYLDFQKQKLLVESGKENSSEKQITLRDSIKNKRNDLKNIRKFKYDSDDPDPDPQVYPTQIRKYEDNGDVPFSQFKEILKENSSLKLKSKYKNEYDDFVMQEISDKDTISKKPQNSQNCFLKISKYKNENIDLMYENNKNIKTIYKYDEKLGYQYPVGKNIKGKINVPFQKYNRKLQKDGSCIYDDDGEFLYRVPFNSSSKS